MPSIQQQLRRGDIPCRGANLGGWLVAEHWLSWDAVIWQDVPEAISCQGEFATMKHLGHDVGDARFEQHRASWIQEADIAEMKRFGVNTVRVPVGFWIMGNDPTDVSNKQEWAVFAPNAIKYLDQLINDWCQKYDLAVLISIHSAKGSQNGKDHSAPATPGTSYWSGYPENVDNTIELARFLAERYRDSDAFLGIGLLNEPEYPINVCVLESYYQRAYKAIRDTGNDCVLVVAPVLSEQGPPHMENFMRFPVFMNVWHEWHPYFVWGYEGKSGDEVLAAVQRYGEQLKSWQGNWLLLSEWSLGAHSCAFACEDQKSMQKYAQAQLQVFQNAHAGWCFWAWRHVDDREDRNTQTGWSMRQLLRRGVLSIM